MPPLNFKYFYGYVYDKKDNVLRNSFYPIASYPSPWQKSYVPMPGYHKNYVSKIEYILMVFKEQRQGLGFEMVDFLKKITWSSA